MRLVYNNFKLLIEDMVKDALPGYQVYCKTIPSKNIMSGELAYAGVFSQFVDVLFINKNKEYGVAMMIQNLYKIYQQSNGIEEVIEIVKKAVSETMENPENFVQKAGETLTKAVNAKSDKNYEELDCCRKYASDSEKFEPIKSVYSYGQKKYTEEKPYSLSSESDKIGITNVDNNILSIDDICLKICNNVKPEEVYRKFFDMYIVYYNESENVTKAILNDSKMSEEKLYNIAAENSARKYPMTFVQFEQGEYLLTTKDITNGAAAILYPGVLKKIAEELQDDLYLVPRSEKSFFVWKKSEKNNVKEEMQKYYEIMNQRYGLSKFSEYILHYHKDSGILTPLDSPVYKI